jgi:hypothetical protein
MDQARLAQVCRQRLANAAMNAPSFEAAAEVPRRPDIADKAAHVGLCPRTDIPVTIRDKEKAAPRRLLSE